MSIRMEPISKEARDRQVSKGVGEAHRRMKKYERWNGLRKLFGLKPKEYVHDYFLKASEDQKTNPSETSPLI